MGYVVAIHDHADHIGGTVGVLPLVTVEQFVTNGVPASTQTAINLRRYLSTHAIATDAATAGDTLALDPTNVTVTVLNPPVVPGTDRIEAYFATERGSAVLLAAIDRELGAMWEG